jgi:hypothetical protein
MLPLTVVILTKNEERNIARCLEPLLALSDDILVMDSGSTDRTVTIAQSMGARVVQTQWLGYSATKNKGNQLAKNDWILSLDADEEMKEELVKSILELFQQELLPNQVFAIQRKLIYCGKTLHFGAVKKEYRLRIFNRSVTTWNHHDVHEDLQTKAPAQKIKLKGFVLHHSYASSQEHLSKLETYAQLSAQQMLKSGRKASFIKCYLSPPFGFFKNVVLRVGFLDGSLGIRYARENMWYVGRKYQLLKQLTR